MDEAPLTPLDVPAGVGRIVLFGGTFDPPHRAHVELPLAARGLIEELDRQRAWLVFVPAARSPHKRRGPEASDADRVAMLRLALQEAGSPERALIWTDEIDRAGWAGERGEAGPSYMIDTVRRAARAAPDRPLSLLIGADQALSFHRWRDPRELLRLAPVFVMPRADVASGEALVERLRSADAWSEKELEGWKKAVLRMPTRQMAATPVREWLAEPARHEADLAAALGPGVLSWIQARGLYSR